MLSFENDYSEGAHPKILARLAETNLEQQPGYGEDGYTLSAAGKIRAACECPGADVYFLAGGTQTNRTVISALLHTTEGAVCADTGHIACHEAGAVESTGHKVIPLPGRDGKLQAEDLRALLRRFYADPAHAHMVWPGMATPRNTAPCIPVRSWKPCPPCAGNTACPCSWTGRGWATA